jgi:hypothetical protein
MSKASKTSLRKFTCVSKFGFQMLLEESMTKAMSAFLLQMPVNKETSRQLEFQ